MSQSDRNKSPNSKKENDSNITSTPNLSSPTKFLKDNKKRFKNKLIPQNLLSSLNNHYVGLNILPSSTYKSNSSQWTNSRNNIVILANASAIELYFLLVEDENDAEKLCVKCSEKFFLPLTLSETIIQAPLIASCIQVLARLAIKFSRLAHISVKHLTDFLLDPSPILYKQYKHIADKFLSSNFDTKKNSSNEAKGKINKSQNYQLNSIFRNKLKIFKQK